MCVNINIITLSIRFLERDLGPSPDTDGINLRTAQLSCGRASTELAQGPYDRRKQRAETFDDALSIVRSANSRCDKFVNAPAFLSMTNRIVANLPSTFA
jgi:hypothetical protein